MYMKCVVRWLQGSSRGKTRGPLLPVIYAIRLTKGYHDHKDGDDDNDSIEKRVISVMTMRVNLMMVEKSLLNRGEILV